jgi:putative ABC transport system permease protein
LLVGGFVIANTFAIVVAQRGREVALLRLVGASRRQVRRAVLVEAAVLGLVGAALGTAIGIGAGLLALAVMRPAGQALAYVVSPAGIVLGCAVGIGVSVLAGYGSARRAAATPPIAALAAQPAARGRTRRIRAMLGFASIAAGAAAVAATAGSDVDTTGRGIGMAGALLAWAGLLLLAPTLAAAVLRSLSRLAGRRGGPAIRLALRNAARDPRRTAATASALLVGVALVCAFATVGESITAQSAATIRALVPATSTLVRAAPGSALSPETLDTVRATPGVNALLAAPHGYEVDLHHDGRQLGRTTMSPVDPAGLAATLTPQVTAGSADLRDGILLPRSDADAFALRPGDTVTLTFTPDTTRQMRVAGVYDDVPNQAHFYIDAAQVPAGFIRDTGTIYATGPDPSAVRRALTAAFADRPDIQITDRETLVDEAASEFQLILSVVYALFGVALLIAVCGIVNTLALSVLQRTREIGVLRAVGADRRLIRHVVRWESLAITGYGGLLGVAAGLALGAAMQRLTLDRPLLHTGIPYPVIAAALLGMVTVAVLAAAWPARRAARTDMLTAIATP